MFRQYIWRLCSDFGAVCELEIGDETTHLISNRVDTEKVLEAEEAGIPIIKPEWIYGSVRNWKILEQDPFRINPKKPSKPHRTRSQKRRLDEAFENEDDLLAPPIIFDASELDEINKELKELDDDDDDDLSNLSEEVQNSFNSESAGEYDQYSSTTNSEQHDSDQSLDDLEESLF
jgi:hypothetical protein